MDEGRLYWALFIAMGLDSLITIAYAALQNAKQGDLQAQIEAGQKSAKQTIKLLSAQSRLTISYILSQTFLKFTIAIIGLLLLVEWLAADTSTLIIGVGLFALAMLTVVITESIPESIGSAYSGTLLPISTLLWRWIILLLSPLTIIMLGVSRLLARLFGSSALVNTVTEAEIMTLVNAGNTGGTIEDAEREMIFSILQLDQTLAREVMIPRIDMVALDVTTTVKEALTVLNRTGYSRIPIYEENVDHVVGVLYAKDVLALLNNGGLVGHTVRDLVRTAYYVTEGTSADVLLRDLRSRNVHMAIVVDEYGGTSGLVTIENILEEIVGDIRDEYDHNEEYEYIQHSDDEYLIDASMDLDDLNNLLDMHLDTSETDTLGGYIYRLIERVPIVGELIETDEMTLRIRSLDGRRIRKILVKRKPKPSEDDDNNTTDPIEPPQQIADAS